MTCCQQDEKELTGFMAWLFSNGHLSDSFAGRALPVVRKQVVLEYLEDREAEHGSIAAESL